MQQTLQRLIGTLTLLALLHYDVAAQNDYALIPYPLQVVKDEGAFMITPRTVIITDPAFKNEAALLSELFKNSFGKPLSVQKGSTAKAIILKKDISLTTPGGYKLSVSTNEVVISAGSPEGAFMAVQTVRQLLPASTEIKMSRARLDLPSLEITDAPRFQWRGIHLDVSRHFFSLEYIRKLIGLMSLYKFNKLHLHLTDDQGWRVEIKKYPKLTEEGAWRSFNNQDSACMKLAKDNPDFIIDPKHIIRKNGKTLYGGFYSQEQLKSLVQYATARHIEIIPEIDMPGHMVAAISSYRYLSCDGSNEFGKFFSTPICPCKPETIAFAKDIFTEIMELFPSRYIHIGGDEVDRSFWERSEACEQLMKREGLKTAAEIQSWFIREMEKFFMAHGKKLIGWDEVLEGGIDSSAVVMYWRTWVPGAPAQAARNGNDVIMTPGAPLYFSEQPDRNSLPAVYNYDPVPKGLSANHAVRIIGAQGNLWTEYIPTEKRADYLYMPRMTALAEVVWSGKQDYNEYLLRMQSHYPRLDALKVSYRLPDLALLDSYAFIDQATLSISKPLPDMVLRYTSDGTPPTSSSPSIQKSISINESKQLRIAAFMNGTRGDIFKVEYKKQSLAIPEQKTNLQDGLKCNWFKRAFDSTTLISGAPHKNFTVSNVVVPKEAEAPSFTMQYRGYFNAPDDGIYTFYLMSDDASRLKIADRLVINNDGMHAPRERNGQVALKKGLHRFDLDFIEGGGGYTLKLQYSRDGSLPTDIPDAWFKN